MNKLTIHNKTTRSDLEVVGYVNAVIAQGKSQSSYATTFYSLNKYSVTVVATKSNDTYTFEVIEEA